MPAVPPRLLILETSGRIGQVALAQGEAILVGRRLDEARRHARDLVPAVAELLAAQGWQPRDLEGVLVSRGPGSYTGLRVGIMSAKTLAYATGCVLLAVDTFAAIAVQAPEEAWTVDVLGDAQQNRVYVQRFARLAPGPGWQASSALAIQDFDAWLQQRPEDVWVNGPALRLHEGRLPPGTRVVAAEHWDPQPPSLLRIGLPRFWRGERDDVWTLEPLYLRLSAAEEKWQRAGRP
ncbi:MAG: tRNA (adenosine(37)-N6)-threonylcarbamoyltransferase complex dimerization subunit type 1 TsaB [Gemmataceae bacterium]|nr:tRNA (adenosine(37)-N6)-threonylcarbamoyltransferase complex dimerization subunit type 1 TsaB [Gemmataceae bacterium]